MYSRLELISLKDMKYPGTILAAAAIITVLLASCATKELEELSREELFGLQIGKMDNQIDLFQINGVMASSKNGVHMQDGLFYVANGNSAKVMGLSSYGDLIFLLYNPEENPPPTSFSATHRRIWLLPGGPWPIRFSASESWQWTAENGST